MDSMSSCQSNSVALLDVLNMLETQSEESEKLDKDFYKSLSESLVRCETDNMQLGEAELDKGPLIISASLAAIHDNTDNEFTIEILSTIGIYLDIKHFTVPVSGECALNLINELFNLMETTSDKVVCTKALSCMSKEKLLSHVSVDMVDRILEVLSVIFKQTNFKSFTAKNDAIALLKLLLRKYEEKMCLCAKHWLHDVAPFVNHNAIRVRTSTLLLIASICNVSEPNKELFKKPFFEELDSVIVPIMKERLFKKQDVTMLKLWCNICDILGTAIHQGTALLNNLLEIVERGFKSTEVKIKVETFNSWKHLIDNFALVPDVICSTKRLQLLMRPLLANNAQIPAVAKIKFSIWWHLVCTLKPRLPNFFHMVCNPLVLFCFTHDLPRSNAETAPKNGQNELIGASHQFLHQLGTEAMCQLLCGDMPEQPPYSIDLLKVSSTFGSEIMLNHSSVLLTATEFLTKDVNMNVSYVECIWKAIRRHLKFCYNKPEIVAIFSHFVHVVASVLNSNNVTHGMKMQIFEIALDVLAVMPAPVAVVEPSKRKALPVHILLKNLLGHQFITFQELDQIRYLKMLKQLLQIGSKSFLGALGCSSLVVKNLMKAAQYSADSALLSEIWSAVCELLLQHMSENGDMNEGDSLGHDFSCSYDVLLFPYLYIFSAEFTEQSKKELSKKCDDLYAQFLSSVTHVENVGVNTCVQELFEKMFTVIPKGYFAELDYLEEILSVIGTMVKSIDWHQLSPIASTQATARKSKKQNCGDLVTMFVEIFSKVLESVRDTTSHFNSTVNKPTAGQKKAVNEIVNKATYLVELIVTAAPNDILTSSLATLTSPVELIFAIFTSLKDIFELNDKHVLYMWNGIISAIIRSLDMDSQCPASYFASISQLVRAALTFPQEEMKKITYGLWQTIRSQNSVVALIPPQLRNAFESLERTSGSPVKRNSPAKNQLEFVEIPPKVRKQILTEHQREQLKKRRFIPAMYSELTQDSTSQSLGDNPSLMNFVECESGGDAYDVNEAIRSAANDSPRAPHAADARNSSPKKNVGKSNAKQRPSSPRKSNAPKNRGSPVKLTSADSPISPTKSASARNTKRMKTQHTVEEKSVSDKNEEYVGNHVEMEDVNGDLDAEPALYARSRSLSNSFPTDHMLLGVGILKAKSPTDKRKSSTPRKRVVSFADPDEKKLKKRAKTIRMRNGSSEDKSSGSGTDTEMSKDAIHKASRAARRGLPVFPKLLACADPVSAIVSRLSPSICTRGLNHILKARNIITVGDLSRMPVGAIKDLPIKSPKLDVVESALKDYYQIWRSTTRGNVMQEEIAAEEPNGEAFSSKSGEMVSNPNAAASTSHVAVKSSEVASGNVPSQAQDTKKSGKRSKKSYTVGYKRLKTLKWTRSKIPRERQVKTGGAKIVPPKKGISVNISLSAEQCITGLVAMSKDDLRALSRAKLTEMMSNLHTVSGNILGIILEKETAVD